MNVSTLVFLGLAIVWAVVLLPELFRKISGSRHSDTIRSFNHQLSVLHRSGDRHGSGPSNRSNVIDFGSRRGAATGNSAAARPVPMSVRKRRQEVLTVLGSAAVLTLVCTVAFGGAFLILHVIADVLLLTYVVLLAQVSQPAQARTAAPRPGYQQRPSNRLAGAHVSDGLRTATVGRATPSSARRIAN